MRIWRGYMAKYRGTYLGLYKHHRTPLDCWRNLTKAEYKKLFEKANTRLFHLPGTDPYEKMYDK